MTLIHAGCAVLLIAVGGEVSGAQSPEAAVNELLAADRSFSAAGATSELTAALSAMFADDVIMPLPGGRFARGREATIEALAENPANGGAKLQWEPVRGGVSADGLHGFTFGFMTTMRGNTPAQPGKYLAYWVKGPSGWKVAAYKRAPRAEGEVRREKMPPSLPSRMVAATTDASAVAAHRTSLIAAEKAFSDLAQRIGLGPAFRASGHADAMNLGRGSDFVYGNDAIGELQTGPNPTDSPFTWSADDAFVASSGDLGVTFGIIHAKAVPAGATVAPTYAFFTIWRRDSTGAHWKYIAE